MNKLLFLDRDGVVNIDHGHVYKIEDFDFVEGIFDFCKKYQTMGYKIVIVTNQAGIAKGLYTIDDLLILNDWIIKEFKKHDITIEKIYYCPHREEDNCGCRKPKPGMFLKAIKEFNCDVNESVAIGDKMTDLEAANSAGIKNLYFLKGKYPFKNANYKCKEINKLN